jgi:hypothetical protein
MKQNRLLIFTLIIFAICLSSSMQITAGRPENTHQDTYTRVDDPDIPRAAPAFSYEIEFQTQNFVEDFGSPYTYEIDNCGSETALKTVHKKAYRTGTSIEFGDSRSVGSDLGIALEGLIRAEAQNEIQRYVHNASEREVADEETVEFLVPGRSKGLIEIQWKKIWANGNIEVVDLVGQSAQQIPFRALVTTVSDAKYRTVGCPLVVCSPFEVESYSEIFQRALNNAAWYVQSHHSIALDEKIWLQNSHTRTFFVNGFLKGIELQWARLDKVEWKLGCMSTPVLDLGLSTAADQVYSMYVETALKIEGNLNCPGMIQREGVSVEVPISGELRMDTLYPGTVHADTRVVYWNPVESPAYLYRTFCSQEQDSIVEAP